MAGAEPVQPVSIIQQGYQTVDHRYARPHYRHVYTCSYAHHHPPHRYTYRPYYTRWYVHPYYRWQYATYIAVHTIYGTYAWVDTWTPPYRAGWVWMPGFWARGYWNPGYWAPVGPPPTLFVYVPGYWIGGLYIDGYYRSSSRSDGDWDWVAGQYMEDGTYVPGHWRPTVPGPEGYTWEPGFWDGEAYVDGFWRPMFRDGFRWQGAYFDANSVYHSGFWEPLTARDGQVWVPGWFDGNVWQAGYFVATETYRDAKPEQFAAPEGWNAGWSDVDATDPPDIEPQATPEDSEGTQVLGIPVE